MAKVGTTDHFGRRQLWVGIAGVLANDVVLETTDVSAFDSFQLMSGAGAMKVLVSLDGTLFTTAPLSMVDQGAVLTPPVITTAALRMYGFDGVYKIIQIQQDGAPAVANPRLLMKKIGE